MNTTQNNSKKYSKGTLALTIVLSGIAAIGGWEILRAPRSAFAAPKYSKFNPLDAGVQRQTLIAEQKKTNAKLGELIALLKSGKMKIIAVKEKKNTKRKK